MKFDTVPIMKKILRPYLSDNAGKKLVVVTVPMNSEEPIKPICHSGRHAKFNFSTQL